MKADKSSKTRKAAAVFAAAGACLLVYWITNAAGQTSLRDAIDGSDTAQVVRLLKAGAYPNTEVCTEYETRSFPDWVPARVASSVEPALPKTCRIRTPLLVYLMQPTMANRASTAEALLQSGANAYAYDTEENTALGAAVSLNDRETVRVLLDHGANPNKKGVGGNVPLCNALQDEKHIPMLRLLLERGANVDGRGLGDQTDLMFAVQDGDTDLAAFLLAHSAQPNAQDDEGNTALHYALFGRNGDTARLLTKHGASLNIKNKAGEIPSAITLAGMEFPP